MTSVFVDENNFWCSFSSAHLTAKWKFAYRDVVSEFSPNSSSRTLLISLCVLFVPSSKFMFVIISLLLSFFLFLLARLSLWKRWKQNEEDPPMPSHETEKSSFPLSWHSFRDELEETKTARKMLMLISSYFPSLKVSLFSGLRDSLALRVLKPFLWTKIYTFRAENVISIIGVVCVVGFLSSSPAPVQQIN